MESRSVAARGQQIVEVPRILCVVMEMVYLMIVVVVTWLYTFVKTNCMLKIDSFKINRV